MQNFWRIKLTPKKTCKLRQNTQKIANFLRYYGKIHSKLPIFRVKSVKIYTGQKKFTWEFSWLSWQIWGMFPSCTAPEIWLKSVSAQITIYCWQALAFLQGRVTKEEKNFKFDNLVWKARLTLDLTNNDVYTFSFLNKIDLKSLPIFAVIFFQPSPLLIKTQSTYCAPCEPQSKFQKLDTRSLLPATAGQTISEAHLLSLLLTKKGPTQRFEFDHRWR